MQPGQVLLHFRIVEKIGEGGMGAVWRATDTTLNRDVALKVLPQAFSSDAERLARFEREAKLLASLSHPNIAGVFGLHEAQSPEGELHFLTMELVEGEDLAKRLERGDMPLDLALKVGLQMAAGIEAAHERGVIHRDLKPANVILSPDGRVRLLDFGLAKAIEAGADEQDQSRSPTMTSAGTVAGMILGTAAYMSPEQAAAQPIDRRCDIWSFGVVLYELLSGKKLFEGETTSHTLAAVLRARIDLESLPRAVPSSVRQLLERCLDRDPTRRLRDIGEARIALERAIEHPEEEDVASRATHVPAGSRVPWIVAAAALVLVLATLAWVFKQGRDSPEPVRRFTLTTTEYSVGTRQGDGRQITIAPDGSSVVTQGGSGSDRVFYIRRLDEFEARPIPGTNTMFAPHYSPDGQWISFVSSDGLSKVRPSGGGMVRMSAPISISNMSDYNYHWADDDYIYYSLENDIWRFRVAGGEPEQLTSREAAGVQGYASPHAVPDAGVVFCQTVARDAELAVIDLESKQVTNLGLNGDFPLYLPHGQLLFRQNDQVLVAGFDIANRRFTSAPTVVLDRVVRDETSLQLALARNGTAAYLPRRPGEGPRLVYVDRAGRVEPVFKTKMPFRGPNDPRISPDGKRLVLAVGTREIWMVNLVTQTPNLLAESGFYPVWSPDSSEIIFTSVRNETMDVYRIPVDLSRPETKILDAENNMRTMDWARQGQIVLREQIPDKGMDLLVWSDPADESARDVLLDGEDDELAPDVSPDGRWVAYVSDYSGADEVYVTSFPQAGARVRISNRGGHSPCWSPDGKKLYYLDGISMIEVSVNAGEQINITDRKALFEGFFSQYRWSRQYDITPDGERFVMVEDPSRGDIEIITRWTEELRGLTE